MNLISRIRNWFDKLMTGRYGNDSFNRFLIAVWVVLLVIGFFVRSPWWYLPEFVLCFVIFFRMLSRNVVRRRLENTAYYHFTQRISKRFRHVFVRIRDRKTSRFFRCPQCRAEIRMPRKVGKFRIHCPKCGNSFVKEFRK